MSLIPRSATYPSLGGSPRGRHFSGRFSFLGAHSSPGDSLPCTPGRGPLGNGSNGASGSGNSRNMQLGGSWWKGLLTAVALVYCLAFITVPAVYSRLAGAPRDAAVEPGTHSLAPRRMALQTLEWPDTGLAERHYGSKNPAQPRVEFRDAGR